MFLSTQHGGPSKCLNLEILIHSLGHKPIGPHLTCVSFPVPANLEYYYIQIFFFFGSRYNPCLAHMVEAQSILRLLLSPRSVWIIDQQSFIAIVLLCVSHHLNVICALYWQKELPVHVSFSPSSMGLISSSLVIKSLAGKTKSKVTNPLLYIC